MPTLHSILDNPNIFNPFSKYLGDQRIVSEVIKEQLTLKGDERILDLGCGTGNLSRMFPSQNYVGVDSNKHYIDFARKVYDKNFLTMNASCLEFGDDYFDLIFTKDIFHHLDDDVFRKALSEMKRVLKAEGQALIIEISYQLSGDLPHKKFLRCLDRGRHIREFEILSVMVAGRFCICKKFIRKGFWGDLAVFVVKK